MRLDEYQGYWQERAEEFGKLDAMVDGSKLIRDMLAGLRAVSEKEASEVISLAEAAHLSGYSTEHLARCIRTGQIANAGQKNRPRIRREDLPRKPKKSLELGAEKAYNVDADARSILSRRGER